MTNAEREARVFRDELIRRLASDIMDAVEHVRRKRPDVSIWVQDFDSEEPNIDFATIGVAIGPRENQKDWRAHVFLGTSRDGIVDAIVDAIKFVEEKRADAA